MNMYWLQIRTSFGEAMLYAGTGEEAGPAAVAFKNTARISVCCCWAGEACCWARSRDELVGVDGN